MKYHVTIDYGLFRITTVGTCMPCRRPSFDIKPEGQGTVSDCEGLFWSGFQGSVKSNLAIALVLHRFAF